MIKTNFFLFIAISAFFSFFSYSFYNPLPTNALFELLVMISFLLVSKRMSAQAWAIFSLCLGYILYTLAMAKLNGVHLVDYFLAYKTFVYILILSFFSGKFLFDSDFLVYFYRVVLFAFFFKYITWLLIADFERPGLFAENNFELMFLLLFSIAIFSLVGRLHKFELITLVLIVFLSGSRSGVLALFAVLCVLYIRNNGWKTVMHIVLLSVIGAGVGLVIASRLAGGGVESIDRFVFLQGFIIAISDWGIIDFLVGSKTLTPLPDVVCDRLGYYKTLFSAANPSICYSVILHSYVIRVLFDHGIIGFIFVFGSIWCLLKISGLNTRGNLATFLVLLLNGLSVSSLNSVYAMMGLIILLGASYKEINDKKLS